MVLIKLVLVTFGHYCIFSS